MSSIAWSTLVFLSPRPMRRICPLLRRNRQATVGGTIAVALVIVALAAPRLAPYDPAPQDLRISLQPPFTFRHPLGTDEFGRDTLSRLIFGARVSLVAGILTAA